MITEMIDGEILRERWRQFDIVCQGVKLTERLGKCRIDFHIFHQILGVNIYDRKIFC